MIVTVAFKGFFWIVSPTIQNEGVTIMREYMLHETQAYESTSVLAVGRRIVANLWKRRTLRKLSDLDDHVLRDIGLRRDELDLALHLPLTIDPLRHLIHRRTINRGIRHG
jgi:uncharacterized protein YjiS (DUF1127 family)